MIPRRIAASLAALIAIAGMWSLSACSTNDSAEVSAETRTLTYLEPQAFATLYPPAAGFYPNGGVVNNITDRLLYQDPDTLELHPWIAVELPEINSDATEYTFRIRTDVTYSDGTAVSAENVVANLDLYGLGNQDRRLTASEQINNYEYGEVLSPDTVRFHFSAPSPGFAQAVSTLNAGLLADSSLAQSIEGFGPGKATGVIGSGPFVITEEALGSGLTLSAREDYDWAPESLETQGRPWLDQIHFVLAGEDSVRTGALVAGQAQIARQIEAPVERHLENSGITILSAGTNGVNNGLSLRFRHPLLEDIRVRQAIIAGVDREEIIRTLFSDSYPLATSSLASTALGYTDTSAAYIYDPQRATELLDAAGWTPGDDGIRVKDGHRLSLNVNHSLPQPRSQDVITKIQENLKRIGIEVTLQPGDQAAQNAAVLSQDTIQVMHTMVGRADYDVIKSQYYSTNRNSLLNFHRDDGSIGDPELERLLEAVSSSAREEDRAAASAEVQRYLADNAYVLPLFEEPQVFGIQPYVHGFTTEAVGRPSFYGVRIHPDNSDANAKEKP
ncbi:TIGR04028 family ABC transporter substrate-binding protein [Corynebacterium testudinoris]|uniref:ABC transporter substrate binding protein n=1 Tax=Corynebacterium testudinoris TaxID=136857 RepID=A0A0G3H4Q1_9CORY|nr:ABC transporter substrate binding protein [Corynebacterium testudinoris]